MRQKRKIYFFFSNVIDSAIYRSLILEFATEEYELFCVFIGEKSLPLVNYSRTLPIMSRHIPRASKIQIVQLIAVYILQLAISRPKIVFCFGQTASIVGLTSSALSCKAQRFYLRMHTSMNKVERFPRGILYDKLSNFLAEVIVVPNKNTKNYLVDKENVDADKLVEINFGFHLKEYELSGSSRVHNFREQYDIPENSFVIGIASRFTHFKGLQYSLPALNNFLEKNPQGILVMAVTGEEVPPELDILIKNISRGQLRMAPRGCDMPAFYNSLNVFIHTPIDETVESFGLVYVESFAAGVATIVTLSGIAKDICVDGENCLVVDFCNTIEIENSLDKLFIDKNFRSKLAEKARQSVSHLTMTKMRHEYRQLLAPPNKF